MSTPRFLAFMPFIFEWEGGYDNDPDDPGGRTWFGIDIASHPNSEIWALAPDRGNKAVWEKAKGIAAEIYFADYWQKNHCEELPELVGEVVMNIAVNAGSGRAGKWLQTAIGTTVDGSIGPKTVEAATAFASASSDRRLAQVLIDRTQEHYLDLSGVKLDPEGEWIVVRPSRLRKFLKGWLNRNNALRKWVAEH